MPSIKMFPRSFASRDRAGKATKPAKRSFREATKQQMLDSVVMDGPTAAAAGSGGDGLSPGLTGAIATLVVGPEQRLFAAHEDVLCHSAYFAAVCRDPFFVGGGVGGRRIYLPDEDAEVFSCVLEYLYKGDYQPRLVHDKRRNTWRLASPAECSPLVNSPRSLATETNGTFVEGFAAAGGNGAAAPTVSATIFHATAGDYILRDTAVYCAADRYGLEELKRMALRKQGLQSGIEVSTILRSARFAYSHTPDSDSRLRAHYLALIIRSRRTFKRSGTMQLEMERGGKLFFDLFVAMCNHMDDLVEMGNSRTPKTI